MAKYSTGDSSGDDAGGTCELCGAASDSLREQQVAGATLQVCPGCAHHGDSPGGPAGDDSGPDDEDRKRRAARNAARLHDAASGDSTRWEEEGTNYDDDPLPYLRSNYEELVEAARQDAGLQRAELADELGVPEESILALEQGRAARAGVGGSVVEAVEERLDVELTE